MSISMVSCVSPDDSVAAAATWGLAGVVVASSTTWRVVNLGSCSSSTWKGYIQAADLGSHPITLEVRVVDGF